jgi:hypothetical protein
MDWFIQMLRDMEGIDCPGCGGTIQLQKVLCPECRGAQYLLVNAVPEGSFRTVGCDRCNSTGVVVFGLECDSCSIDFPTLKRFSMIFPTKISRNSVIGRRRSNFPAFGSRSKAMFSL